MSDEKKEVTTEEQQQENAGKVQKAFADTVDKISAIIGKAPDKKRRGRVSGSLLDSTLVELFREEDENTLKEFKSDLKALLEGYVKLHEEVDKKKREVAQLEEAKMKEFNQEASKLLRRVEDLPSRLAKYKIALAEVAKAKPAEDETNKT